MFNLPIILINRVLGDFRKSQSPKSAVLVVVVEVLVSGRECNSSVCSDVCT